MSGRERSMHGSAGELQRRGGIPRTCSIVFIGNLRIGVWVSNRVSVRARGGLGVRARGGLGVRARGGLGVAVWVVGPASAVAPEAPTHSHSGGPASAVAHGASAEWRVAAGHTASTVLLVVVLTPHGWQCGEGKRRDRKRTVLGLHWQGQDNSRLSDVRHGRGTHPLSRSGPRCSATRQAANSTS